MKEQKVRFIQLEFYTIPEENCDYMVIVQIIDNKPSGTLVVRLPTPYTRLPRFPYIQN